MEVLSGPCMGVHRMAPCRGRTVTRTWGATKIHLKVSRCRLSPGTSAPSSSLSRAQRATCTAPQALAALARCGTSCPGVMLPDLHTGLGSAVWAGGQGVKTVSDDQREDNIISAFPTTATSGNCTVAPSAVTALRSPACSVFPCFFLFDNPSRKAQVFEQ